MLGEPEAKDRPMQIALAGISVRGPMPPKSEASKRWEIENKISCGKCEFCLERRPEYCVEFGTHR